MRLANRPPSQLHRWCINAELLTAERHHLRAATPSRMRRRCPRCQERSAASPAAAKGFAATMPMAPEAAGVPADCCPPHSCNLQSSLSGTCHLQAAMPLPAVLVPECKPKHRATCAAGAGAAVLPAPPDLSGKVVRANWNATALAYLGDSVWEVRGPHHSGPGAPGCSQMLRVRYGLSLLPGCSWV